MNGARYFHMLLKRNWRGNTVVKVQQGVLCSRLIDIGKGFTTIQHLGQWSKLPLEGVELVMAKLDK